MLQRTALMVLGVLSIAALPTASAWAGVCPNEALRSELHAGQLPDCRAYELVSPRYKEGAFISSAFAVSPDGLNLIAGSLGAFAGTEEDRPVGGGNVQGVAYELSRVEGVGWVPSPLAPPASTYSSRGMFDASADLSATLWELGTLAPAQAEGVTDFYLERPRGTFARIGPATPSPSEPNVADYTYLGGSEDLSHVLFSASPGFRWPFDATAAGGGTLYEYVGVERSGEAVREPALVGVGGDSHSTALLSQCGTRLGSSSTEEEVAGSRVTGSMYNAISASGERIFFTAVGMDEAPGCAAPAPQVSELFAREEIPSTPGEQPAAHMRSVAISEPAAGECQACLTGGELKDATFQGASLDGSKVFFTTEQELLPGAGGENLYEYDFNAPAGEKISRVSVPLAGAAQVQGVARISEDGSHVYFVAEGVLTEAPNGALDRARAGEDNLYVYERDGRYPSGHISFVATLAPFVSSASPGDAADWQRADERPVLASADGSLLVFTSVADLLGEGLGAGKPQVFQYDALTGGLVRASIGQNGYNDNGRNPEVGSRIVNGFPSSYGYAKADSPAAASAVQAPQDGAVFFQSADGLTEQALNDQPDALGELAPNVYEYRAGSVYLLSDGHDVSAVNLGTGVSLAGSDSSGGDVFFFTSAALTGQDGDTQQDIYDARIGGGFPSPQAPSACAGEACLGGLAPAPSLFPLGGSATQAAEAQDVPALGSPQSTIVKSKVKAKRAKSRKRLGKKKPKAKSSPRARARGAGSPVRAHLSSRPRGASS